ncbi:MAG: glycoside hydrolase family 2 protein [Planctomycetota bacterium]
MDRQDLSKGNWTVRAVGDLGYVPEGVRGRVFAATVPGCIHTDLMDAGVIPDPAVGMNEALVQWVSEMDWCYELAFVADGALFPHHEIELCFECLDTIATVELNGVEVGRASSEFMPWRFSVGGILKPGENLLGVMFASPLRYVREMAEKLGSRPHNGDEQGWAPYTMIRKCASNFGWDWGPKVATCGIAGGVVLEAWSNARLALPIKFFNDEGYLFCGAGFELVPFARPPSTSVFRAKVVDAAGRVVSDISADRTEESGHGIIADLNDSENWHPAGCGGQTLYTLTITVESWGKELDRWSGQVGASQVYLPGDKFTAPVFHDAIDRNRLFCKGANWIPEGLWPRDRTPERIRERLMQAKAAGMNMIRVWGGGRYESDAFYDICDELGLMVWQDFMFACGCYPEEEPLRSLVEAEARYQVARLSRHPCVVVWCGGNENHWAYESWGFKERLKPGQTWGKGYWQELLPRIVSELSPHTPYVPDSPWSPTYVDKGTSPNEASEGDRHTWDLFGEDFRKMVPRFCSEFGVQSPSCLETLREAGLSEPESSEPAAPAREGGGPDKASNDTKGVRTPTLAGASGSEVVPPALLARQRGPGGMKRWYDEFFAKAGLPPPTTFEQWHAQAQQLQADWLYLAIVWLRANAPTCSGALIWQLNDAWPGFSWSLIDSAGREKPAYHAVKRAFSDRLLERVPFDGVMHLVAINDTDEAWEAEPTRLVPPRTVAKWRV